jgi:hypothetical protein
MEKTINAAILNSPNCKLSVYPEGNNVYIIIDKKKTRDSMVLTIEDWEKFIQSVSDLRK